jgi:2-desacetyl-2-hydroxyethyl bacteriochlorophyllide A dehydrogenase
MRAAVCQGPGRIELEDLPIPEPAAGEVRVRVSACGICGSDLHLLPVGYLGRRVVPGHELAGRVDALGPGVAGLAPGDAVAVEPLRACGACPACRDGRPALCLALRIFGIHENGGLAEYVTVPAERAFRVPVDLPPRLAALAEPMAVVVHGLRRGGFGPGARVLVLGAGTLGLLCARAARSLGAGEVWVTARHPHQAQLARELGATRVLAETEADELALAAHGREQRFDCVVESVGGEADTLRLACAAAAPGATISVLGLFRHPVRLEPGVMFVKELTIAWSNCYDRTGGSADFEAAIRLLDAHRVELAGVTTHQVKLDEVNRAFALAADRRAGAVKVTVVGPT